MENRHRRMSVYAAMVMQPELPSCPTVPAFRDDLDPVFWDRDAAIMG